MQQWSVCSTGYYHSDCIQLAATQMIIKYQIDRDYSHFPRIDTHLKLIFVKILLQFVKEKTAKFMRHKNNQKTSWDCNNDRHLYRSQPQPPKVRVIQQQGSGFCTWGTAQWRPLGRWWPGWPPPSRRGPPPPSWRWPPCCWRSPRPAACSLWGSSWRWRPAGHTHKWCWRLMSKLN